jgi:hypothetical protein
MTTWIGCVFFQIIRKQFLSVPDLQELMEPGTNINGNCFGINSESAFLLYFIGA